MSFAGQHVQRREERLPVPLRLRYRGSSAACALLRWAATASYVYLAVRRDFSSMHSTIAFSGRIQVQTDHVDQFLLELRVVGQLERIDQVRFQTAAKNTRCTVAGDTPALAAIVRHDQWVWPSGVGIPCQVDDLVDLLRRYRGLPAARPAQTLPSFA